MPYVKGSGIKQTFIFIKTVELYVVLVTELSTLFRWRIQPKIYTQKRVLEFGF